MKLALCVLSLQLLTQADAVHLRIYDWHVRQFAGLHNDDLGTAWTAYLKAERDYTRATRRLDATDPHSLARERARAALAERARRVAEELSKLSKQWKSVQRDIEKLP